MAVRSFCTDAVVMVASRSRVQATGLGRGRRRHWSAAARSSVTRSSVVVSLGSATAPWEHRRGKDRRAESTGVTGTGGVVCVVGRPGRERTGHDGAEAGRAADEGQRDDRAPAPGGTGRGVDGARRSSGASAAALSPAGVAPEVVERDHGPVGDG